jgi:uroporphyrinogen III methyltransferase/synthase
MSGGGIVYLVGAGPGDPDLVTLAGARCLGTAEVVLYDALVQPAVLKLAPDAALEFVGKRGGEPSVPQERIVARMIQLARAGKRVVRLKGGDPFIFGRGGEEAAALAEAGVRFEVVPGVTAAVAAAATAGIPLTHRGLASAVAFVTGHEDPAKPQSDLDYDALARAGTLVFYMGVRRLGEIAGRLIAAGMDPDTPAATVMNAALPSQRTATAPLSQIAAAAEAAGIAAPAITIVGPVAALRRQLAWFEARPLFGKRVLVTRAREQSDTLSRQLTDLGAEAIEVPTIRIEPPPSWAALDEAVREVGSFAWIAFTSANGVSAFFDRLRAAGRDARALAGVKLAVVGPATQSALARHGLGTDCMPETFRTEDMAALMAALDDLSGKRVLLPRSNIAPPALADRLREAGAQVVQVVAYRTVPADPPAARLVDDLAAGRIDWGTFTSGSTARNFAAMFDSEMLSAIAANTRFASIGPVTSAAMEALGLPVAAEAEAHNVAGLIRAIVDATG